MKKILSLIACLVILMWIDADAQVSTVEFGKNRVQYQKFKWKYYQTNNFNTYFAQDGLELGKYVAQIAETELPELEEFVEYGIQRRANIIVYNNFNEMEQSNIGIGIDWQNTGGVTKFVNNKVIVYFDGNHDNLRRQVRQGIARILVENLLFGDDLGEFAANQALLDLPKWLTDGYVAYAAENWSPEADDQTKSALLSGRYNNFYQFAFERPEVAGHAFWYYFANKYGKNKTTYLLYLARIYRNINNASQKIAKKKFKEVLKDFMTEEPQRYYKDIRGRRNVPKGQLSVSEETLKKDFIRFNANPVPRSFTYAVVEFRNGQYCVVLHENFVSRKVLLKLGVRSGDKEQNPNYPILAWDNKGTRLAVLYNKEGKIQFFIYDVLNRVKIHKTEITQFDQVQDMKYMLDANTLLLSAVKSGQTDLFTYKISDGSVEQITNDVYDDLDASFVAFPNKTGIIYSSNRPSANAASSSDSLPAKHFNVFLIDNWNKSEFKQISQLTDVKYGNARFPSQYNTSHFTFVSDENGINNRYAGFFKTERAGLDTLVFIGDEILRNPQLKEVDSLLKDWGKSDVDSVGFVSVTNDSAYVFPLSNYQSSLLETRTAGDNTLVSEVVRQGDFKFLYRLRVDENTLRRRNITSRPTEFVRKLLEEDRRAAGKATVYQQQKTDSVTKKQEDFFQNEFQEESKDSSQLGKVFDAEQIPDETILTKAKLFEYRPPKFATEYAVTGFNNNVLVNRFQRYQGGGGPINLSNGDPLNGMIRVGIADLMEDWKVAGGFRISPDLRNKEYVFSTMYLKKRIDYGFTYYRNIVFNPPLYDNINPDVKEFSNLYQGTISYPFDKVKSIRFNVALRSDRDVFLANDQRDPGTIFLKDIKQQYGFLHVEYVYDNAISKALNIWNGLRYKIYGDWNSRIKKNDGSNEHPWTMNVGFDARNYYPIYRNLIWAVRVAGDYSWGPEKFIYYLGGVDNWLMPKFNNANRPAPDNEYAFQSLAVNMRGFKQNVANGNNNLVINSEVRLPVFSTLFNKPINNAFLRNFQVIQFFDLGTAWNGAYDKIERPSVIYSDQGMPVTVRVKAGGVGPFVGSYGFGARSTLLGYFLRLDAGWEMNGFFKGKPMLHFAMGVDF